MSDNNREYFTSNTRLSFVPLRSSQGVEPASVGLEPVAVLVCHSLVASRFDESLSAKRLISNTENNISYHLITSEPLPKKNPVRAQPDRKSTR